jgi:hypothetical protein
MDKTKGLPFFGERQWRENQYQSAFEPYAKAIGNNLNDNGAVISIERYTADYGLLGWMQALESEGINPVSDKCCEMRATDISSVKDYSVTFAKRGEATQNSLDTLNSVLSKSFKSGVGYEGYMAEFSLYYDTEGEIEFYDVYNDDGKLLHQFAISTSKSGKIITYEASGNKKKVKYFNAKKKDNAEKSIQQKLEVYSPNGYKTEKYLLLAK